MEETNRSVYIDYLRGLSAVAVCLGHFRHLIFAKSNSIPASCVLLATGLAHQAVVIFFVISGYLIGGKLLEKINCGTSLLDQKYIINRISRIYPPLIGALIVTLVADAISKHSIPSFVTPFGELATLQSLIVSGPAVGKTLGNLFLLQIYSFPVLGSNEPLWSLSYEWWIYFLFPLLLSRKTRIVGVFLFLVLLWHGTTFMVLLLIWVMGAVVYRIRERVEVRSRGLVVLACTLFALLIILNKFAETYFTPLAQILADLLLGAGAAVSIPVIGSGFSVVRKIFWKRLAGFSYSLYLTHFPLMILFFVVISVNLRGSFTQFQIDDMQGWCFLVAGMAFLLGAAYIFSLLFERPLQRYKMFLLSFYEWGQDSMALLHSRLPGSSEKHW